MNIDGLKKHLSAQGRVSRKQFNITLLICFLAIMATVGFNAYIGFSLKSSVSEQALFQTTIGLMLITLPINIYFVLVLFATSIRRVHDLGHNKFTIIWGMAPLISLLYLIYITCFGGIEGKNKYGPDPLEEKK